MARNKLVLPVLGWSVRTKTAVLAECFTADIAAIIAAGDSGHTWIAYGNRTVWDSIDDGPTRDYKVITAICTRRAYQGG